MKIELTDDEVKTIGSNRYNPGRKSAVSWALSLVTLIIAVIFFMRKDTTWWDLVLVLTPLAWCLGQYILLLKKLSAAGRRFLEEQKKLQWEVLPKRKTITDSTEG